MAADKRELVPLVELSARLGQQPLLVQGSTGNTSIKIRNTLWVKASGKWMANAAKEDVFVPVNFADADRYLSGSSVPSRSILSLRPKPSIETAMHLILPHRVVIHVHSVNTIAWAVQRGGRSSLRKRLEGLRWCWIGYTPSGVPLAKEIGASLHLSPNIFVLANHGLVVGGESCEDAEARLQEVERRLAIAPRNTPEPDLVDLERLAPSEFQLPQAKEIHSLATDAFSSAIVSQGILYPCQAMFLGRYLRVLSRRDSIRRLIKQYHNQHGVRPPALMIRGKGVLVANDLTTTELQTLLGLSQVVQRLRPKASIAYLDGRTVDELLSSAVYPEVRQMAKPATNCASA
jgi:rhamnose utilization protein RhaD (predicted bifunctional aldolase and dehydrogenase)